MSTHMPLEPAQISAIFPDAPSGAVVPDSAKAQFKATRQQWRKDNAVWFWVILGSFLLGIPLMLVAIGFVISGVALIAAIVMWFVLRSRAHKAFWKTYSAARGFELSESGQRANVPLYEKGDKNTWGPVLTGNVGGHRAQLALYTYTEISTDSDGNRSETDYDWTTVSFTLPETVAQRYLGLYCRPKTFSFGALQDKLAHDRKVELESLAFNRKYSLRALDQQDDVALRELFSPTFIDALTDEFTTFWEQRGSDLVIYHKGHETEVADLDRMCMDACRVLNRYLEEWQ